jgi:hypothetical protein
MRTTGMAPMKQEYTSHHQISSPLCKKSLKTNLFKQFAQPEGLSLIAEGNKASEASVGFSRSRSHYTWSEKVEFRKASDSFKGLGASPTLERDKGVFADSYLVAKKKVFKGERLVPLKPFVAVESCSDLHNPKYVTVCSCNDFLRCGVCRRKRLKRTQKRVRDYMVAMDMDKPKHHTMKFLTLTYKREGISFEMARKSLLHSFTKLRKRKNWNKKVSYYFATLEVVEGNVHLHIVLTSSFWNQRELSDEWLKVTGTSFIVDIRKVTSIESATKELAKYIAKDVSEDVLEEVAEFRDANKKCRYVFSGRRPPSLDTIAITSPKMCSTCSHPIGLHGQFKDEIEAKTWVDAQTRCPDGHIRTLSYPQTTESVKLNG